MVFPTEETPFKSDNATELFNSGQPLPLPCTGGFGARPHGRCSWLVGRALPRAPASSVRTQVTQTTATCRLWQSCWETQFLP